MCVLGPLIEYFCEFLVKNSWYFLKFSIKILTPPWFTILYIESTLVYCAENVRGKTIEKGKLSSRLYLYKNAHTDLARIRSRCGVLSMTRNVPRLWVDKYNEPARSSSGSGNDSGGCDTLPPKVVTVSLGVPQKQNCCGALNKHRTHIRARYSPWLCTYYYNPYDDVVYFPHMCMMRMLIWCGVMRLAYYRWLDPVRCGVLWCGIENDW